jgi:dTDP-4-amino-4,6-dideoxygalactose transaminase
MYYEFFKDKTYIKGHSKVVDGHAYHLYVIEVEKRNELMLYLREQSIYAQAHYIPVHLMPYYRDRGWKKLDFPLAEKYYSRCLSLPMYPTLTDEDFNYVIKKIETFFSNK